MKSATDDILTYDQYAEREKRGFALPYVVEASGRGQNLLFYGSEHTNNPEHSQFTDIENRWTAFVHNNSDPIALVEGRFDGVSEGETDGRTKSIVHGGEAQFVVYLARKYGVGVASPEPDRLQEANSLAKEFGRDTVVFYYFIRQIGWWNRFTEKPDIQAEGAKMLRLMQKTYQWSGVNFNIGSMLAMHEALFDKPLPWDDTQWVYGLTMPVSQQYVTNQLARRSGELRDKYIFGQIQKYWNAGKSPFLVFGAAHAVVLEPALCKLVD